MTLQTATNPQTGQKVALINGQWVPFTDSATNPQTGEKAVLVKGQWITGKQTQVPTKPTPPQEESGFLRQAADVPVQVASGIATGVRLITDSFGADNPVSQNIRGVEDFLQNLLSAQAKNNQQEVARIMAAAEDQGIGAQLRAALESLATAPVDLIASTVGTAVPTIAGGLAAQALKFSVKGAMAGVGAVMGAGTVKSSIYDEVKNTLVQLGASPEEAETRAVKAQEYGGENLDQILLGTMIGGVAGRFGIESTAAKAIAKDIAGKTVAKAAAAEAAPEAIQAAQEQVAQNIALQREGVETPTFRGAVGAGALEGLIGVGVGGLGEVAARRFRPEAEPEPTPEETETITAPEAPPVAPSPEPKTIPTDEKVSPTPDQLAEAALREIGPETETKQYRKKIEEITGLNPMQAGSLLARLTKRGVITAPDVSGLRTIGEAEPSPTLTKVEAPAAPDIDMLLGDLEEVSAPEDEAARAKFDETVQKITTGEPDTALNIARAKVLETGKTAAPYIQNAVNAYRPEGEAGITLAEASRIRQQLVDEGIILGKDKVSKVEPTTVEIGGEDVSAADVQVTGETKPRRRGKRVSIPVSGEPAATTTTQSEDFIDSRVGTTKSVAKRPVAGKSTEDTALEKVSGNTPKERYESVLARLEGLESTGRMTRQVADRLRKTVVEQGNPALPDTDYETILSQAEQIVNKAEDWASEIESGKAQVFNRDLSANERLNLNESMLREQETMAKLRAVQERRREEATASVKELRSRFAREDEPSYVAELRTLLEANEVNSAAKVLARAGAVNDQPKRFRPIYKAVADKIKDIDFSRIRIQTEDMAGADLNYFKRLRDDSKLGEFDPSTNTISLRSEVLTANTVLHELVHASTVQTIRQYELDPSKLTEVQRDGVERLNDLRTFAQTQSIDPTLAEEYKRAFESPYEFVAVAMTSPGFQHRLAKLEYNEGSTARNAWTDFVKAIAKVFGLRIKSEKQYTALDEAGQAFSQILAAPTQTVEGVAPLAERKKAEEKPPKPKKDLETQIREDLEAAKVNKFNLIGMIKYRFSKEGANKFVEDYQNAQRPADVLQSDMDRSELTIYDGENMNTLGAALDRSAGRLRNNENVLVPNFQTLDKSLGAYAAKLGVDIESGITRLSKYFTAETVNQRRITNFIKEKPLKTTPTLRLKGSDKLISYAQYRNMLIDSVLTNKALTDDQRDRLYQKLLDLTINDTKHKYADSLGDSYSILNKKGEPRKPGSRPLDITDDYYNIISYLSYEDTKNILDEMTKEMQTNSAEISAVRQALLDINVLEQKFNEEAGFLSQPAKNLIKLYGWDKYVPLAGKMKKIAQENEDRVYRNSLPNEVVPGFRGREDVGNNPILMTKINAGKAAARAANTDVTLSMTNLMKPHPRTGEKYIDGELVEIIPFKEQYTGEAEAKINAVMVKDPRQYFYQRMSDGNLAIWRVDDPKIVNAVRPEFDPGSVLRRFLQTATNFVGQQYTRYKPPFAPYDFVRNVSFNTGAFKSEFGSEAASNYILDVGSAVFKKFRLPQMWKISKMHSIGDFESIKKLGGYNAKTGQWKDPFIRGAYEFLERGGKVSVVQTWQTQRRLQRELEALERGPVRKFGRETKDFLDSYFDAWIDSFDLVARVVAYNTAKSIAVNNRQMTEAAAQNFATNFAKNLANFEKRGAAKAAKRLSAMYAFFAPSATGAVRNLDALAPAFKDVETMVSELPAKIKNDPQAVAAYRKNYEKLRENARGAMGIYFAAGMMGYFIALSLGTLALGGDDEEKKNAVADDEMELWTRNLRLPLNWFMEGEGKRERFFQIPWGFGMGSFAAAGAQIASVVSGNQPLTSAMANTAIIGLDSYLPLPVARYNPWGNLGVWALDSVMPTAARGMFEYAVNIDGLGRQIYRDYHNRFGPAYVPGGSTQEAYRDLSKWLADVTNQSVALEPSEAKFLLSTFIDAGAAMAADFYDLSDLFAGRRDFDPKQDLLIFDSFFGTKIDKDVSNYQEVRNKVERFRQGYTNAANSPREGAINRFVEEYPNAGGIAWRYNQLINDMNQYNKNLSTRLARAEDPRERQRIEDEARKTRRLQMRRIINMYEQNKKEIDAFNRFNQMNPF